MQRFLVCADDFQFQGNVRPVHSFWAHSYCEWFHSWLAKISRFSGFTSGEKVGSAHWLMAEPHTLGENNIKIWNLWDKLGSPQKFLSQNWSLLLRRATFWGHENDDYLGNYLLVITVEVLWDAADLETAREISYTESAPVRRNTNNTPVRHLLIRKASQQQ